MLSDWQLHQIMVRASGLYLDCRVRHSEDRETALVLTPHNTEPVCLVYSRYHPRAAKAIASVREDMMALLEEIGRLKSELEKSRGR